MRAALGKLYPNLHGRHDVHLRIVTGLPVDHLHRSDDLIAALSGRHAIRTDTTEFVAQVTEVMVVPQPYGTVYRRRLAVPDGQPHGEPARVAVVDIGTYTIDGVVDENGTYIDALSGSSEAGVYTVLQHIAAAYERTFGAKPGDREVEHILRTGSAQIRGRRVDCRVEVERGAVLLRDAALTLMGNLWQAAETLDVIYVTGGGAPIVFDAVRAIYEQAVLVDDPQFSNAQGYLAYGLLTARSRDRQAQ
jgi:hypothetical protein